MRRLPFQLLEWTRTAWSSAAARDVWAPRVARITAAWDAIERAAVAEGVKPSCLQSVDPHQLAAYATEAAARGLVAIPLGQTGSGPSYRATSAAVVDGQPWVYRVALTSPALAADWQEAWTAHADDAIGLLLGFPRCCRVFFAEFWARQRFVDLTWPAAVAGAGLDARAIADVHDAPCEANILGRWIGVRLVSHMPCTFHCGPSAAIGAAMADVGRRHGYADEVAWITEILSWPADWSALHGIAQITTPVYRVSTRTDATADVLRVRYHGDRYPALGASGNDFPFQRRSTVIPLTSLRSYTRGFEATPPATDWTDNGFGSRAAMAAAHAVVASVLPARTRSVLDLGCGNGILAHAIAVGGRVIGVDVHAPATTTRLDDFYHGPLADVQAWHAHPVDITLLMPGRLTELDDAARATVLDALRGRRLVVYAYGDWLTRYGTLEALTRAAGLPWAPARAVAGDAAAAAVLDLPLTTGAVTP